MVWGYLVSTVVLWHATYTINSLAHTWGTRRYDTDDTSRNNPWLALLTLGEGWHNNHHHFCSATRQGFRWWEIDITYYALRALQAVGLVWEIREPPAHVLAEPRARRRAKPRSFADIIGGLMRTGFLRGREHLQLGAVSAIAERRWRSRSRAAAPQRPTSTRTRTRMRVRSRGPTTRGWSRWRTAIGAAAEPSSHSPA